MKYDAIIIGAGMSGLAAGIRLAMFDKKIAILEKHTITGGLNSYYQRRIPAVKQLFKFDVGLHALTNYADKGERGRPFTKLLKQLRIPHESFKLKQQTQSRIQFASASLRFNNDGDLLLQEISEVFPNEIDAFVKFQNYVESYNETDLEAHYTSARAVLDQYFKEELLKEMLIAPLLIYGSAWEHDMDFSQFVIMFKALYIEGFSRPEGGVRTILKLLEQRYAEVGGEIHFRKEVCEIKGKKGDFTVLTKKGEEFSCRKIFSSMGLPETFKKVAIPATDIPVGQLSFTESILLTKDKSFLDKIDDTIVFYNDSDKYLYRKPQSDYDSCSAVFCLPDNYQRESRAGLGQIRITYMANYANWVNKDAEQYMESKNKIALDSTKLATKLIGSAPNIIYTDIFTPRTIEKYTSHLDGTVYGSTHKIKKGVTSLAGLYIIGTDQGFLGIVGSMLSGISMANLHGLMNE